MDSVGTNPEVGHAERIEHTRPQDRVQPLAGDPLDDLTDPVDPDPVFPRAARVEQERRHQAALGAPTRLAGLSGETLQRSVEIDIAEAGRVQHQHAGRHVALRRPKLGRALVVEPLEHLNGADLRRVALSRRVEVEAPVLDELQRRRPGDRLGAGEQREDAVGGHRLGRAELPHPRGAFIDVCATIRDHRDDAGNAQHAGHGAFQNRVGGGGEFRVQRIEDLQRRAHPQGVNDNAWSFFRAAP